MTSSYTKDTGGLTANENAQSKLIQAYFKNGFREEAIDFREIKLTRMKQPFTQKEIHETIYLPKNKKNTRKDRIIAAASLKNSPYIAHSMIGEIYSETTAAGDGLVEFVLGILNAMQKSIYLFVFSFLIRRYSF